MITLPAHARLAEFAERLRSVDPGAPLDYTVVNELRGLIAYRQAVLWRGGMVPSAISSVSSISRDAPFTDYLVRLRRWLADQKREAGPLLPKDLPADLGVDWEAWFPGTALWLPLPGTVDGGLLLTRQSPAWSAEEQNHARVAAGLLGDRLLLPRRPRRPGILAGWRRHAFRAVLGAGVMAIIAALTFVKVPISVLAPFEIVSASVHGVRAPLQGVVKDVLVTPNQAVTTGQILFRLDGTTIENDIAVAEVDLARWRTEFEETAQRALNDSDQRLALGEIAATIREREAELSYLKGLRARLSVVTDRAGRVEMAEAQELLGKPVALGEAVLRIADERDLEIEAWLPAATVIPLEEGSPVMAFLSADPLRPVAGEVTNLNYRASLTDTGVMAHKLTARLVAVDGATRLGSTGTLRATGPDVSLGYWLLRRPIAAVRQTFGV